MSDGTKQVTYKVISIKSYPFEEGPIEEIFGFTSQKRLHLITCSGDYNLLKRTHEERLVITAIAE
ncbi:class F sortase [Bacillus sp. AK128]